MAQAAAEFRRGPLGGELPTLPGGCHFPPRVAKVAAGVLIWALQAAPAEGFEYKDPVPIGFHNFFVLIILVLTALWAAKVVHQAWTVALIHRRLMETRPLTLERMSIYARDLQQLIRQHFNQILRMRRMVPPQEVPRHTVKCHVRPESLEVIGDELLGVRFIVDSELPCVVRLYWGVPVDACESLLQQFRSDEPEARHASVFAPLLPQGPGPCPPPAGLLGGPGAGSALRGVASALRGSPSAPPATQAAVVAVSADPGDSGVAAFWEPLPLGQGCFRSSASRLPAGLGLTFSTLEGELLDPRRVTFDLAPPGPVAQRAVAVLPLVITVTTKRLQPESSQPEDVQDGHTQVTLVRFRRRVDEAGMGGRALQVEVLQQLALGGPCGACRVLGIFGFEDEEGGEAECMVCYDRPRSVVLLPCRHCSVCPSCLRSLRDEQCPLCRSPFTSYLLFPLLRAA